MCIALVYIPFTDLVTLKQNNLTDFDKLAVI